jgi:tryptophan 2,3-dioxygenase
MARRTTPKRERWPPAKTKLAALIDEAIVDATASRSSARLSIRASRDALRDTIAQDETLLATLEARWEERIRPPTHYGTLRHNPSMASSAI